MNSWQILLALLTGLGLGLFIGFLLHKYVIRRRQFDYETIMQQSKQVFADLSLEALSRSTGELVKLARSQNEVGAKELQSKKALIDQTLEQMSVRLDSVKSLVQSLDKDRAEKFGELAKQLQMSSQQTAALTATTDSLRQALAGSKTRGQWGERMAEDVLRLAGFVENVNYVKQKTIASAGTRPDFTFLLPKGLKVNMDVKFPLDNYLRYLEAGSQQEKARCASAFLADVKNQCRNLLGREYINPEQYTVDYVLMFIPNEQVFAFIQEQDRSVMDQALAKKIIFCSPLTLFAILAVIRQAVDNFALEQVSNEILSLLGQFNKQWGMFKDCMDKMGEKIEDAHKQFGVLSSTRTRMLDRQLDKIEQLRSERGLPATAESTGLDAEQTKQLPAETGPANRAY